MPNFSVLMSVYHKESAKNLNDSLESIYTNQTLKPNQIVLVKDGPLTEELELIISNWKNKIPSILYIIKLDRNLGLASALNEGLKYCSNEFIARMDSDDISLPQRFELQFNFMKNHPEVDVISGQIEEWDDCFNQKMGQRLVPTSHDEILIFLKRRSPINHPAAFYKKSAILSVNGYPNIYPEDYLLWIQLIINNKVFANLPETILKMRTGRAMYERRGIKFLKGELNIFHFLYKKKYINIFEFFFTSASRIILRTAPGKLKYLAYMYLRR